MKLPTVHGSCNQQGFFIYAACDCNYFNDFAWPFIRSAQEKGIPGVHLHIFNPTDQQLEQCRTVKGLSITHEYVNLQLFQLAADRLLKNKLNEQEQNQFDRTNNAMIKGNDQSLLERMQKTYYACARFIRLAEIFKDNSVLAVDIDAVVQKPIQRLDATNDIYIHRITGRKARFLAGGFYLHPSANSQQCLNDYAGQLTNNINNDYLYWGLDQDILETVVPKYAWAHLPIEYIDWGMNPNSYIWTAKGARKSLDVFVNEQRKYIV
jgi:hypothetical protein